MLEALETIDKRALEVVATIVEPIYRAAWDEALSLAKAKASIDGTDRHFLDRARNALAYHYHYDIKPLANGYEAAFLSGEETPNNQFAWMSTGNTLGTINFFFVDAAVQRMLADLAGTENTFDRLARLATTVAYGTTVLVAAFMNWRVKALAEEEAGAASV